MNTKNNTLKNNQNVTCKRKYFVCVSALFFGMAQVTLSIGHWCRRRKRKKKAAHRISCRLSFCTDWKHVNHTNSNDEAMKIAAPSKGNGAQRKYEDASQNMQVTSKCNGTMASGASTADREAVKWII